MSIASFEGKNVYRIDYVTQERVADGPVRREAVGFFVAESPAAAIEGLEEWLEPQVPEIHSLTMVMAGEDLRYRVSVLN